jgi:hypothetical protein
MTARAFRVALGIGIACIWFGCADQPHPVGKPLGKNSPESPMGQVDESERESRGSLLVPGAIPPVHADSPQGLPPGSGLSKEQ